MSVINDQGDFRGIQVFDKKADAKGSPDYPFLSIKRINEKSADTQGRLKKMIRFLKTLKADSDAKIDLNSFDINAICYDIKTDKYSSANYLELVVVLYIQFESICNNQFVADNIMSVDGLEPIFKDKPHKIEAIKQLFVELKEVFQTLIDKKLFV